MENIYSSNWFSLFMEATPSAKTISEVEFLKQLIPLNQSTNILDLCCGTGRHAHLLAEAGYQVYGIDNNLEAINQAKNNSLSNLSFEHKNIFEMSLTPESFDAVICMWQSFGFGTDNENVSLVQNIHQSLKKNGLVFLDIYNKNFFDKYLGERTFEVEGVSVTEHKEIYQNRLKIKLSYSNTRLVDIFDWQVFSPGEIIEYMYKNGFKLIGNFSSFTKLDIPNDNNPRAQYLFEKI